MSRLLRIFNVGRRVTGPQFRFPKRATQIPQPQAMQLQRVRFRRAGITLTSIAMATIIYYNCYTLYMEVVMGRLSRWLAENLSEEELKQAEEEADDPFIIPLPFTTKIINSLPYSGLDPEWQAFIKFSKDHKAQDDVRERVASLVLTAARNNPMLAQRSGGDISIKKTWLDFMFPYNPPPEIVRSGISIEGDGVYLVEETIDSLDYLRVQRTLWPAHVAKSVWSYSETLFQERVQDLAKFFGYDTPGSTTTNPNLDALAKFRREVEKQTEVQQKRPQLKDRPEMTKTQAADGSSTENIPRPHEQTPTTGPPQESKSSRDRPKSRDEMLDEINRTVKMVLDVHRGWNPGPWEAFKRKFAQTWTPIRPLPPRGSLKVHGLVRLESKKAYITVDVQAWWDPKTEKFHALHFGLRAMDQKNQHPLR